MKLNLLAFLAATASTCDVPEVSLTPISGQLAPVISELPHSEVVVILEVKVTSKGSVSSARVTCSSSDNRAFARAALESIPTLSFETSPQKYVGEVVVRFPARE